jgi:hypothetical protein
MTPEGLLEPQDLRTESFLLGTSNRPVAEVAICDLPPPKRPFKPACFGQLCGDHLVKAGTFN